LEVSDKVEFSSPPKKQLKEPALARWLFQFNEKVGSGMFVQAE
jgi:hypothetical protein